MSEPLLRITGLSKAYPGVVANDDVSFDIGEGEIHALLGENGAGKSTLVKAIYGLVTPDRGTMTLAGRPYRPTDPRAARASGVAMVFQHFSLFDAMSVAENIALGMDDPPPRAALPQRIREVSAAYGLPLDPAAVVGDLSAGQRQRVEILRCLLQSPRLLIMDEPTSVLTPQEVEVLFRTLRQLRDEGRSILYISHKLEEIRALCDHATVLRRGRVVGECVPAQVSARDMAEMMVGAALTAPQRHDRAPGPLRLQLRGVSTPSPRAFGTALRDVSLDLRAGEVLGIGGVAGNGQEELLAVISGEMPVAAGMVTLNGAPVGHLPPAQRRGIGVLSAPEERLGHAAAPGMTLIENALLTGRRRQRLTRGGIIGWDRAEDFARDIIARFDVRTPGTKAAAQQLSGGNLQKFVIGREIAQAPSVLVVNQPTWGVDAAAAASIRQALLDLADQGTAVLVISQDLDELMEIADNFCALNGGALSAAVPVAGLSTERIGMMLGGAGDLRAAGAEA